MPKTTQIVTKTFLELQHLNHETQIKNDMTILMMTQAHSKKKSRQMIYILIIKNDIVIV
jgi:hypothetical protein